MRGCVYVKKRNYHTNFQKTLACGCVVFVVQNMRLKSFTVVLLVLNGVLFQETEQLGLYGLGMSLSGMVGSGVGTAMTLTHALSMSMMHSAIMALVASFTHGFSTLNTMVMSIASGFVIGNMALAAFIVFLLVLVPADEARSLSHSVHKRSVENVVGSARAARFISRLVQNDPLNCMPLIMCGLSAAQTPSERTDVLNDYAYMVKHFLEPDDKSDEEDELPPSVRLNFRSGDKKTVEEAIDDIEREEDENIEDLVLTEMSDDPNDLPFALHEMKRKGLEKTVSKMTPQSKVAYLHSLFESEEEDDGKLRTGVRGPGRIRGYPRPPPVPVMMRSSSNRAALQRIRRSAGNGTVFEKSILGLRAGRAVQNPRQCRSLFQECPVNTLAKGDNEQPFINRAVNNLRRVLLGSGSGKRGNEIKQVVESLNKQSSGSEVKVVLNISPPGLGGGPIQPNVVTSKPKVSLYNDAVVNATTKKPMTYHVPKPPPIPDLDLDGLEEFLRSTDEPAVTDIPVNKTVYEGNIRETIGIFDRFKEAHHTTAKPQKRVVPEEQSDLPPARATDVKKPVDEPEDNINAIVGFIKQLRKRNKACKGKKKCKWNKKKHEDTSEESSSEEDDGIIYRPPAALVAVPHPQDRFNIQWKSSSAMVKHGIYHLLFGKHEAKPLRPPGLFRRETGGTVAPTLPQLVYSPFAE